jgi:methyl-accepting chemotaxis protein
VETRLEDVQLNNESTKELLVISDNLEGIMEKYDKAIGEQMLSAGSYIAKLLSETPLTSEDLVRLTKETGLTELHLINEKGEITQTSNKDILGFCFSREKGTQTYEFLEILSNPAIKVNQRFSFRQVDGKLFKYTGLSITGRSGIIQCGLDASEIVNFKGIL